MDLKNQVSIIVRILSTRKLIPQKHIFCWNTIRIESYQNSRHEKYVHFWNNRNTSNVPYSAIALNIDSDAGWKVQLIWGCLVQK